MLPVGNPGNEPDRRAPFGAVGYPYAIGKYEVTNEQYAAFLNAVAAADPNALYNEMMESDWQGGIIRQGEPGSYRYSIKEHRGNKPVVFVSWFDALRFCNWLHNGRPRGTQDRNTTEAGAYTLTGATRIAAGTDPAHGEHGRNAEARFWLPSKNEWHKAAYHNPGAEGTSTPTYWLYPTKSDQPPTTATADANGNINNATANIANSPQPLKESDDPAPQRPGAALTTVGSGGPGSESPYGAADMAGNVDEWTQDIRGEGRMWLRVVGGGKELVTIRDHADLEDVLDPSVTHRSVRGGNWRHPGSRSTDREDPMLFVGAWPSDMERNDVGFRVAGRKPCPGPPRDSPANKAVPNEEK